MVDFLFLNQLNLTNFRRWNFRRFEFGFFSFSRALNSRTSKTKYFKFWILPILQFWLCYFENLSNLNFWIFHIFNVLDLERYGFSSFLYFERICLESIQKILRFKFWLFSILLFWNLNVLNFCRFHISNVPQLDHFEFRFFTFFSSFWVF